MKVLCQERELSSLTRLKRSPEIDSHLRIFSCRSSSAISSAVSSEGKVFASRIALMRLCTRCVWRVSHDQRSPCQCSVHVCDSSDHCPCWSSHVDHQDAEEFPGCCHPISARVAVIAAMLMSGLVAGSKWAFLTLKLCFLPFAARSKKRAHNPF